MLKTFIPRICFIFPFHGQFLHSLEVFEISWQKADGRFIMFSINNAAHILQGGFIVFMDMTLTLLSVLTVVTDFADCADCAD